MGLEWNCSNCGATTFRQDLCERCRPKDPDEPELPAWYDHVGPAVQRDWNALVGELATSKEATASQLSVSEAKELLVLRTMVFRELGHPPHDVVPDLWSAIAKLEAMARELDASSPGGREVMDIIIELNKRANKWVAHMKRKLAMNADRGTSWEECDPLWLLARAREELIELETAMAQGLNPIDVRNEAADVANMAMMVADAYEVSR